MPHPRVSRPRAGRASSPGGFYPRAKWIECYPRGGFPPELSSPGNSIPGQRSPGPVLPALAPGSAPPRAHGSPPGNFTRESRRDGKPGAQTPSPGPLPQRRDRFHPRAAGPPLPWPKRPILPQANLSPGGRSSYAPQVDPGESHLSPRPPPRASVSPRVTRPPGHPFLSSHSNRIPSTAKELIRNSIPQNIFASTSYIQRDHCCPANFPQTLSPSSPGGCGVPAALHHDVPTDPFCPGPLSSPGKMAPGGGAPKSTCPGRFSSPGKQAPGGFPPGRPLAPGPEIPRFRFSPCPLPRPLFPIFRFSHTKLSSSKNFPSPHHWFAWVAKIQRPRSRIEIILGLTTHSWPRLAAPSET